MGENRENTAVAMVPIHKANLKHKYDFLTGKFEDLREHLFSVPLSLCCSFDFDEAKKIKNANI